MFRTRGLGFGLGGCGMVALQDILKLESRPYCWSTCEGLEEQENWQREREHECYVEVEGQVRLAN